jgi:hypothetical protein
MTDAEYDAAVTALFKSEVPVTQVTPGGRFVPHDRENDGDVYDRSLPEESKS